LVEYLLLTTKGRQVTPILESEDVDVWVPALCDVEVVSGVRRSLVHGLLSERRSAEAIEDYLDLPLIRSGHETLLPRMFQLRANFTAYDATYVALSERLGAELLTTDEPLARAVRAHTPIPIIP
jgi:predicted nucleic acid-binding protein